MRHQSQSKQDIIDLIQNTEFNNSLRIFAFEGSVGVILGDKGQQLNPKQAAELSMALVDLAVVAAKQGDCTCDVCVELRGRAEDPPS